MFAVVAAELLWSVKVEGAACSNWISLAGVLDGRSASDGVGEVSLSVRRKQSTVVVIRRLPKAGVVTELDVV